MINFNSIFYKNFMSTGNNGIEIYLDKFDKTLLTGKNGHGKSTMYLALYWCLFGKTFDSSLNTNQIINSINNAKTEVRVKFNIGSTKYEVVRGLKPAKFEIYTNNELKTQDATVRDYQKYLDTNILKMSSKTFQQIVILGSKQYTPFMRLKAKERRSVIEDLLDIQYFSIMSDIVKKRVSGIKEDYNTLVSDIKELDTTVELTQIRVDELNKHNDNIINKNKTDIDEFAINKEELIVKKEEDTKSLLSINTSNLQNTLDNIRSKSTEIEKYKFQINSNKNKTTKKVEFFHECAECPTCEQEISNEFKETILNTYKGKLDNYDKGITKAEELLLDINTQIGDIENDIILMNGFKDELTITNNAIDNIEIAVDKLIQRNKELSISVDTSEDETKIDIMRVDLDKLIDKRNKINVDLRYYNVVIELLKDGGIKTKIVDQYIPVINSLIQKYLEILDFNVEFVLDNEFKETIKSRGRDIFSYGNFSEGQKIRIDLALLFTFREISRLRNSANTNLLIMDEIADGSMDSDGIDDLIKIINSDENNDSNIFIISHNSKIIDHFDNAINFELKNNFTYIDFSTEYK